MKAVIMAGGAGTRLRPLTCDRPKPMVPVLDRPIMEYIIELLKLYDIKDIAVTLQYMPQSIISHFGSGEEYGVNIRYFTEETPLGTAGSVKNAQNFLDEPFIIISGDALTDMNLKDLLEQHNKKGAGFTIALKSMSTPLEYGVVITDKDGKITQFLEKPNWGEVFSDTVNTGIYVVNPDVLDFIPENQVFDFSKDLFPILQQQNYPLYGYVSDSYWCDIGNLQEYRLAQYDILDGKVKVNIDAKERSKGIWIHPDASIDANVAINSPCYIGKNTQIISGASIEAYSVIGQRSRIYGDIKHSIIWEDTYVGAESALRAAIIGSSVKIEDKVAVYQDCVIGDGSILGKGAYIAPGVKIWPKKTIDSNSKIINDIIWEVHHKNNIFSEDGIVGEINVTVTPVMLTALCEAYASNLSNNSVVCVGYYDENAAGEMLVNAALAGLMSAGNTINQCGKVQLCVLRYSVRALGAEGGIHIQCNENKVCVTLLDKNGADISRSFERKVQNVYYRAEYNKSQASAIKNVNIISDATTFYIQSIAGELSDVKNMDKTVIASGNEELCLLLQRALKGICNVNIVKPNRLADASEADRKNALFAVNFDNSSDYTIYETTKHQLIAPNTMKELIAYITIEKMQNYAYIDLTMPSFMEKFAQSKGLEIIKTGLSKKDKMDSKYNKSLTDAIKAFNLNYDSVYSTAHLAHYLITKSIELYDLINRLPNYAVSEKIMECNNDNKGRIIKQVMNRNSGYNQELKSGVKIYRDGGWVLVLPDSYDENLRVIASGRDAEFADELCLDMSKEISEWLKN